MERQQSVANVVWHVNKLSLVPTTFKRASVPATVSASRWRHQQKGAAFYEIKMKQRNEDLRRAAKW